MTWLSSVWYRRPGLIGRSPMQYCRPWISHASRSSRAGHNNNNNNITTRRYKKLRAGPAEKLERIMFLKNPRRGRDSPKNKKKKYLLIKGNRMPSLRVRVRKAGEHCWKPTVIVRAATIRRAQNKI